MTDLTTARRAYAATIANLANLRSAALIEAFATVPRESFLGPGPWHVLELVPFAYRLTPDADPVHLYRDLPVAIDPARMLNNGQPGFVAALIDALDLTSGARVLHVGSGTGYFTAVIAHVVGSKGSVVALEIDPDLAARARANLARYSQVRVECGDGGTFDAGGVDAILVNAGPTHPQPLWLDRLDHGGRLILPLVRWPAGSGEAGASGGGVVVRVAREGQGFSARVLLPCMIFPCIGAIDADADADRALSEALQHIDGMEAVRSLRRDAHGRDGDCWLHGRGYCLSKKESRG